QWQGRITARPGKKRNSQPAADHAPAGRDAKAANLIYFGVKRRLFWRTTDPGRTPDAESRAATDGPRYARPHAANENSTAVTNASTRSGASTRYKTELMAKPVVVVTGIAGNLGTRLLPLLGKYSVIGVDVKPPSTDLPLRFEQLDLGEESSTRALYELLRDTHAYAVIHLAFVIDQVRSGVLDVDRMWHINVAGTARGMEAVTEV